MAWLADFIGMRCKLVTYGPRVAAILLALEDGFRLHRLIDPESTPADSFLRAIGDLQRAMWIAST